MILQFIKILCNVSTFNLVTYLSLPRQVVTDYAPQYLELIHHYWKIHFIEIWKYIFAGIGLNVSNQKPTTCLNSVLQRLTSFAHQLQLEDIIAAFFNKFESFYDIFITRGGCLPVFPLWLVYLILFNLYTRYVKTEKKLLLPFPIKYFSFG